MTPAMARMEVVLRGLPESDVTVIRQVLLEHHAAGRLREQRGCTFWKATMYAGWVALVAGGMAALTVLADSNDEMRAVEQKCLQTLSIIEGRVP